MLDDLAAPSRLARRHREDARPHCRHLRTIIQRQDRAEQRAAECRSCRRERTFLVDREFGAIRREPGEQRRRNRTGEIAPEVRRAEQQDFRLIGIHDIRDGLGIGLVAVMSERRIGDDIGAVGAMLENRRRDRGIRLPIATQDHAGELHAALVRELAAFAQEFKRDRVNDAHLALDHDPDVLIGFEMLRQLSLCAGAAGGRRGLFLRLCHVSLLRRLLGSRRETNQILFKLGPALENCLHRCLCELFHGLVRRRDLQRLFGARRRARTPS